MKQRIILFFILISLYFLLMPFSVLEELIHQVSQKTTPNPHLEILVFICNLIFITGTTIYWIIKAKIGKATHNKSIKDELIGWGISFIVIFCLLVYRRMHVGTSILEASWTVLLFFLGAGITCIPWILFYVLLYKKLKGFLHDKFH